MLSISEYRISSAFVFADNTLSVDVLLRADVRANNRGERCDRKVYSEIQRGYRGD